MKRHVPLSGQPNFRDLGGYQTADGRRVRWGAVYRSGELSQLTEEDLDALKSLGIKTVVDLRAPQEVSARGESRAPEGAKTVRLPIASGDMFAKLVPMLLEGDFSQLPHDLLERVNRALVRDCTAQYAGLLQALLDREARPLVFHCTQGKDRAGFGAAVVLSALGVPWEFVVEDYLLSNEYRKHDNEKMIGMIRQFAASRHGSEVDLSKIEALLVVKPTSIHAAHEEIHAQHGDMETFLTSGLGVEADALERLRAELLE
ncbi:MAG: tyrosine-protein phosphatase [Myxococcota bacterium]